MIKMVYAIVMFTTILISMVKQAQSDIEIHHWLHLENVTRAYIDKVNRTQASHVYNWSLAKDHAYWQTNHHQKIHPVKVEVESMDYSMCFGPDYQYEEQDCSGLFSWSVNGGITSPFPAKVEIMLPVVYGKLQQKPYEFDFNNCTKQTTEAYWGNRTGLESRFFQKHNTCALTLEQLTSRSLNRYYRVLFMKQSPGKATVDIYVSEDDVACLHFMPICSFNAHISFSGHFVYTLSNANGKNLTVVPVNITELAGMSKWLKVKHSKLWYTVTGYYLEKIVCYESSKLKY